MEKPSCSSHQLAKSDEISPHEIPTPGIRGSRGQLCSLQRSLIHRCPQQICRALRSGSGRQGATRMDRLRGDPCVKKWRLNASWICFFRYLMIFLWFYRTNPTINGGLNGKSPYKWRCHGSLVSVFVGLIGIDDHGMRMG